MQKWMNEGGEEEGRTRRRRLARRRRRVGRPFPHKGMRSGCRNVLRIFALLPVRLLQFMHFWAPFLCIGGGSSGMESNHSFIRSIECAFPSTAFNFLNGFFYYFAFSMPMVRSVLKNVREKSPNSRMAKIVRENTFYLSKMKE